MKLYNLIFILLIEAFIFLSWAQSPSNGFKISKESHDRIYFEDVDIEKYKGSTKDESGNLLSLYGIEFNERDKLTNLEKSIFNSDERKQIQKYGRRSAHAIFQIDAVSRKIVCVSFTFKNIDRNFKIDIEKLADYKEEIKRNIQYDYLSFEGGDEVVSGYIRQIIPVFID
ncbi:MAG: hypothetical protein PHG06_11895 [Parabacteroides sp.]|nr:hypothetical protein [Parabacteroides sp.]